MNSIAVLLLGVAIVALMGAMAMYMGALKKASIYKRQLSDHMIKEVEIEAKVDNVKTEIQSISKLFIASDSLIHTLKEEDVYSEIKTTLFELFKYNQIIIYSYDENTKIFKKETCMPDMSSLAQEIPKEHFKNKELYLPNEISTVLSSSKDVPLCYIKIVGKKISCDGKYIDSVFSDTDLNVIKIYLSQSGMVLEKIKAYAKMEKMALTDNLTGLYNRHYANMRIKEEVKRAAREQYPISIVFVDIDKFKSVNDTFGHDIGDLALVHVSDLIKDASREYDVTVRWGGEEFVLLLPNTDENGAAILAERLRIRIQDTPFEYCKLTASLGISSYPKDNLNIEKAIGHADSALYHSKQTGRNRVTLYSRIAHLLT